MREFRGRLKKYADEVDKVLEKLLEDKEIYLSETLISSIKYSLFSGGKRLRPILTRMVAESLNGNIENALKAGSAIEMIHTYSLIHDDLPSMDDDKYRRGKLTNHRVYGSGVAILAGDGLLTYAFNIISKLSLPAENIVKIIELISESAGLSGMVGGQSLDLEAENRKIYLKDMIQIHRAKTAALFRASILTGVYCSEFTEEEFNALDRYAENLGLTFQIVDDILDVIGDEEKLGKEIGSDEKSNKSTYPKLLGLEKAKKQAEETAIEAKKSLKILEEKGVFLEKLVEFILQRQS